MSQNRSRRRGPHEAASQGMFRDFGEPGPSSAAGGAYGGPAQPPTSGQQVRGTRRLGFPVDSAWDTAVDTAHSGTGAANRRGDWIWAVAVAADSPASRGTFPPQPRGTRAAGATKICERPLCLAPFSFAVYCLSVLLSLLPSVFPPVHD